MCVLPPPPSSPERLSYTVGGAGAVFSRWHGRGVSGALERSRVFSCPYLFTVPVRRGVSGAAERSFAAAERRAGPAVKPDARSPATGAALVHGGDGRDERGTARPCRGHSIAALLHGGDGDSQPLPAGGQGASTRRVLRVSLMRDCVPYRRCATVSVGAPLAVCSGVPHRRAGVHPRGSREPARLPTGDLSSVMPHGPAGPTRGDRDGAGRRHRRPWHGRRCRGCHGMVGDAGDTMAWSAMQGIPWHGRR